MITREDLAAICPRPKSGTAAASIWDGYANAMLSSEGWELFKRYDVTTPARMAMFLAAVVAPETGMRLIRESGAYSAQGILRIFGAGRHSAKVDEREAYQISTLPVRPDGSGPRTDVLFERVYGLGNPYCCKNVKQCRKQGQTCKARELGNWEHGDGARCRGLGLNQATGRYALEKYARKIGCSIDELAIPINAVHMALIEWREKNCNVWADKGGEEGVVSVRKLINAGSLKVPASRVNGIPDAMRAYAVARRVITASDFVEVGIAVKVTEAEVPPLQEQPPSSPWKSTEVQLAHGTSGSGVGLIGSAAKGAVMKSAQTGSLSLMPILVELLSNEVFWVGAGLVFAGVYFYLKRKWRLEIYGV